MTPPASVADYRALARARLPRFLFDYIDGGAYAETTLARNVADWERIALRQRVLRDVARIDTRTTILGTPSALPLALAPVGLAGMNARRGEVQAARAAAAAGVPFALSTVGVCTIEEVAAAVGRPFWFQLYMIRDRGLMAELLDRARAAGCSALLFTIDLPVPGARYRDVRSGLTRGGRYGAMRRLAQAIAKPAWAYDVGLKGRPHSLGNVAAAVGEGSGLADFWAWVSRNFDPSVTWDDIAWVRERWPGPMAIKGVLDPADARAAADSGADAVIVSNHGGRQLDGVLSGAAALPQIADAVAGRLEILVDGGVRSGLDIARAVALGASAALVGRPWAWGLAARGEAGVAHVIEIMARELAVALALTGCPTVSALGREALA